MGPTKAVVRGNALYDAKTAKLIQGGFDSREAIQAYASHHYVVLPEQDKSGTPWEFEGKPVYCLRGSKYESLDDAPLHVARCPDCGGLAARMEERRELARQKMLHHWLHGWLFVHMPASVILLVLVLVHVVSVLWY